MHLHLWLLEINVKAAFFIFLQHIVPQHGLSRLIGWFAASRIGWLKSFIIQRFASHYRVNMHEAAEPSLDAYPSFNAFFTRALRDDARPFPEDESLILCPADGAVSEMGPLHQGRIMQAKGRSYSLTALLGGSEERAAPFKNGSFATVYLSPRDYHRVHMPLGGTLRETVYIPGDLFSVNQTTADNVDNLFARNERLVCLFDTERGPMAVILVGAMIVAGIETVFSGQVAPVTKGPQSVSYKELPAPVTLNRGDELGRFWLGSTAIVLFGENAVEWMDGWYAGRATRMGEAMGIPADRTEASTVANQDNSTE
ncbi:archaetidylserine decarboxylase [Pokkaliibacter sp. CJK22405]|uniref:archaetidylserine decarboxylase n=1 Tax=Pokkaliibacter sp. CJK22405 TaxID=3384615 RepID=UPI0039850555